MPLLRVPNYVSNRVRIHSQSQLSRSYQIFIKLISFRRHRFCNGFQSSLLLFEIPQKLEDFFSGFDADQLNRNFTFLFFFPLQRELKWVRRGSCKKYQSRVTFMRRSGSKMIEIQILHQFSSHSENCFLMSLQNQLLGYRFNESFSR